MPLFRGLLGFLDIRCFYTLRFLESCNVALGPLFWHGITVLRKKCGGSKQQEQQRPAMLSIFFYSLWSFVFSCSSLCLYAHANPDPRYGYSNGNALSLACGAYGCTSVVVMLLTPITWHAYFGPTAEQAGPVAQMPPAPLNQQPPPQHRYNLRNRGGD